MAVLTLVSKLFGFFREMVMANFFGTTFITDAYVMSITIPAIILTAIATAYMPLYSKITERTKIVGLVNDIDEEGNKFTSEIVNLLWIISLMAGLLDYYFLTKL